MRVSVTFRHMEASDAVRDHIDMRLEQLKKFLIKPTGVTLTLSVEKFRHSCEIVLLEQHFQAKALEITNDMYTSIDKAFHKIEAQVKKHKNKLQEHHKHRAATHDIAVQAERKFFRQRGV